MPQIQDLIEFPQLDGIRKVAKRYERFGDDYIFTRIQSDNNFVGFEEDYKRIQGIAIVLMNSGEMDVEINGDEYKLNSLSLMMLNSHTSVKVHTDSVKKVELYMLMVSPQFLNDINIDLNAISSHVLTERRPSPMISLTEREKSLLLNYMEIFYRNAQLYKENVFSKNVARSLIQALLYQIVQISISHSDSYVKEAPENSVGRRINYVHDFMQLVQAHHFKERSLAFYAEKLYISPKYLSRIIKESTGRSAADWIDSFVLLEAKNMLRFSNMNIQQVAYALNFSTQSSFGKFFKHLTGMSPSQYQKS